MELTETRMYVKVVTPRIEFEIQPGDVVLLKGSRAVRLDTIVPALEVRP